MMTTGLSQVVSSPTPVAGPALALVVCTGWGGDDLGVEELPIVLLAWTDRHLVGFRPIGILSLCRGGGTN